MGCGSSTCENTPEAEAVCKYLANREHRPPGYLSQDPHSLKDYDLLLNQMGAASSDDDNEDKDDGSGIAGAMRRGSRARSKSGSKDILRRARDITVVSNRSDGSSVSDRRLRSALRSASRRDDDSSSCSASGLMTPTASFLLATSHELKRVSFEHSDTTVGSEPSPTALSAAPDRRTSSHHHLLRAELLFLPSDPLALSSEDPHAVPGSD